MSTFQLVLFGAGGIIVLLLLSMLDLAPVIKRSRAKRRLL